MFLGLPIEQVGQIGGGKNKRTGRIDVAVIQSLYQEQAVKDCVAEYGHIVVDECHHLSAFTFEKVMKEVRARYVVGLTATPARKDGHHPIIFMQCGPIRYRMKARAITDATPFEHVVVPRPTDFRIPDEQTEISIQQLYAPLVNDQARNDMIASDLIQAVRCGRSPLLLTGRTEHLAQFQEKLTGLVKNVFILRGGLGRKQRHEIAEQLAIVSENERRVILATGSYIGEGFDDPRLDTLFSRCRSPGTERSSNTLDGFIACTTASGPWKFTITSTQTSGCLRECTIGGSRVTRTWEPCPGRALGKKHCRSTLEID